MNPQQIILTFAISAFAFTMSAPCLHAEDSPFPGKKSDWNGFAMYKDGGNTVVVPAKVAEGKPWVWRARFWGHQPQFDIALLKKGYHLVYCNVGGLYGSPKAVERWNAFYKTLHEKHGFEKVAHFPEIGFKLGRWVDVGYWQRILK